ncbi:MAG: hypothetical protein PHR82_09825 [Endomicrobiaceae bacterium]|nr:hypothetical protein [Endomicrobiaceae bacterium]
MNELITIQGVRGYIDSEGIAHLNLEDVSRGLGFVQYKDGKEYVRWERVNQYLQELKFPTSGETINLLTANIPENIFYRLAMKASNEVAENFQAKVADEVLPSIRKHGMYAKDELLDNPDLLIEVATRLKEEKERNKLLNTENKLLTQQRLEWADRKVIEALVKKYGSKIGYEAAWREFKKELLYAHGINLNERITIWRNQHGRKTGPKTLDMVHDEEIPDCISTAVALCKANKVSIDDVLKKYNAA